MNDAIVSIPLERAKAIGIEIDTEVRQHTLLCQVVGALRRRDKLVSAIELVVKPCYLDRDLMGNAAPDLLRFERALTRVVQYPGTSAAGGKEWRGHVKVGTSASGAEQHIQVRAYIVDDNTTWAWAVMVHTGPSAFVVNMLDRLRRKGVEVEGLALRENGRLLQYGSESEVFSRAGMDSVMPIRRRNPNGTEPAGEVEGDGE